LVTIALDDCQHGSLLGPNGGNGCSVTFLASVGASYKKQIDTTGGTAGPLPFTVSGSSTDNDFSFTLERETIIEAVDPPENDVYDIY
jgi:hypothetical protein